MCYPRVMRVLLGGPERRGWWEEGSGEHRLPFHGEPMDVASPGPRGTDKVAGLQSPERSLLKRAGAGAGAGEAQLSREPNWEQ